MDGVNGLRITATRCRERQRSDAIKSAQMALTGRNNEREKKSHDERDGRLLMSSLDSRLHLTDGA